jgi:hypothetical protein
VVETLLTEVAVWRERMARQSQQHTPGALAPAFAAAQGAGPAAQWQQEIPGALAPSSTAAQGAGLAVASADPPAAFVWADYRLHKWEIVGHEEGHKWLCAFRIVGEDWDLTDERYFKWKTYLACRPQGETFVGDGVKQFPFKFFPEQDHNTCEFRADFVVRRVKDDDVRLHPGSGKDSRPIYGKVEQWMKGRVTCAPGRPLPWGAPMAPRPMDMRADILKLLDYLRSGHSGY